MKRIEIAGGIASGKTAIAKALVSCQGRLTLENFGKNPFFELFYSNPSRYAFEAEVTYVLQHYSSIFDAMAKDHEPAVVDFSMVLDLAYARVTLAARDLEIFETVFDHVLSKIGLPDLLIKLDCAPDIELDRIRDRDRPAERAITLDYLSKLNQSVELVLTDRRFEGLKVLSIDSDKLDFRPQGQDKDAVVSSVFAAITP